jgi:hypothetical protein
MIQLNLTYEESKMILDLGYDFSKVCVEWQFNFYPPNGDASKGKITKWFKLGEYLVNPALMGMLTRHQVDLRSTYTINLEEAIADVKNYKVGDEYIPLIPIIPKAALEACLPNLEEEKSIVNAKVWLGTDLYAVQEDCIYSLDSDGLGYGSYDLERLKDQEFKSAFKAFIWCHEHYPKELKKKFDEVMG